MPSDGTIKVIIADDHEIFRDGLRMMLQKQPGISLLAEAEDGRELIEHIKRLQPDVVITDIKMPRMDGVAAARHIAEHYPTIGVIALSMFDEDDLIIDMLEAGAKGYLLKNADKNEMTDAIKAVYKDEPYYCKHTSQKLAQMVARSKFNPYRHQVRPVFTDREKEIIIYICDGLTNKEIAAKVFLSVRTVEGLRMKMLEKMNARNTAGIIIYAIKNDLYTASVR
jgi:DNA-binding NarL/FixJ family response regulator